MLDVNRVTLFGRAGRNAERRTLPSGDGWATFTLATTSRWRRKDGQSAERTEWHRVVVFGGAVDAVARRVWEVVVDARGTVSVAPAPEAAA